MKPSAHRANLRLGPKLILAGVAIVATSGTLAIGADATSTLAAQIDAQIEQPRYAAANWGIAVVSLDTGHTLYTRNADKLFQPASTAKLFTAALALDSLGADYRVPTQLLGSADIRSGRMEGSLILYGMGDPTLGTANTSADWADQLSAQLAARGVRRIHGDLIADDSYFASPPFGSGWEARDLQSWFAVPCSALSVQENTVVLKVQAGATEGTVTQLYFDPVDALPQSMDNIVTGARNARADVNLYRAPGQPMLYAFGSVPARSETQTFKLSMPDPAHFAGEQLRQALDRHGISLDGELRVLHWPERDDAWRLNDVTLAQVLSPPLMEILGRGLKRSQNLYLQNLLLMAGAKAQANQAIAAADPNGFITSEAWGLRSMRALLEGIGIPAASVQLEEGAGLSRQDLATPKAMVQLLTYMAHQPYAQSLRDALPIAGVDGTIQWRMRNTPAANNVHAKTGSMNYVHALAGYATTAAGEHLAFAIVLNNDVRLGEEASASHDVDAIAVLLASFTGHS